MISVESMYCSLTLFTKLNGSVSTYIDYNYIFGAGWGASRFGVFWLVFSFSFSFQFQKISPNET